MKKPPTIERRPKVLKKPTVKDRGDDGSSKIQKTKAIFSCKKPIVGERHVFPGLIKPRIETNKGTMCPRVSYPHLRSSITWTGSESVN